MGLIDIGLLSITEIIGDFALKKFANTGGMHNLMAGIVGYIGVVYWLIVSLQGSSILIVNSGWDAMSTLLESLAAFFILGERLTDYYQYFGIFLIIIGLFFLRIPVYRDTSFVFPKLY